MFCFSRQSCETSTNVLQTLKSCSERFTIISSDVATSDCSNTDVTCLSSATKLDPRTSD